MTQIAYYTVATRSYLAGVSVLAGSLATHCPDAHLYVYLVERRSVAADTPKLPDNCSLISVEEIGVPDWTRFSFQYDAMSLCCALKSRAAIDLLERVSCSFVAYLDNDTKVFGNLTRTLIQIFAEQSGSVWLTPHLKQCVGAPNVTSILRGGVFNAGFFAIRNDGGGRKFLAWWSECTETECISDPMRGVMHDQRWLDLSASCFDFVRTITHAGINVGHWDLHEKAFSQRDGKYYVGHGSELLLYHFSGVQLGTVSKYFLGSEEEILGIRIVREILEVYLEEQSRAATEFPAVVQYSFAQFSSGETITAEIREVVRLGLVDFADPFDHPTEIKTAAETHSTEILLANITHTTQAAFRAVDLVARLRRHPIIGGVWRFVAKFINHSLDPRRLSEDREA